MQQTTTSCSDWSIAQAREVYNIDRWGDGYFTVTEQGRVAVRHTRDAALAVDLHQLILAIQDAGHALPVLVRFSHILHDRVNRLCDAFQQAIRSQGYGGQYTAVYPIKVNQQKDVVNAIVNAGAGRVGLEAGSKPELMAVLALSTPGATVICNGYKDREYIRLALIGQSLGLKVFIVVEKLSEIDDIVSQAQALGLRPRLGIRVRLASMGSGKWENTGGEKSKFGLSAGQVLDAVQRLRQAGLLDCVKLLHCHLGSQIANIRDIQRGLREVGRYYAELHRLGVPIDTVDVGGGLGIDYEGTASRSHCSMNYSVQEYANKVVRTLWEVCAERRGLPHPNLITESGRALTAHHAVLITNVIDHEPAPGLAELEAPQRHDSAVLHALWEVAQRLSRARALECYHDAVYWMGEARSLYWHGILSLEQYAKAERIYQTIGQRVRPLLQAAKRSQSELLDELNEKLAEKLFLNFSLFQSMPDAWAIDQVFPIIPLHRLDQRPSSRVVLQDLTCDSDGCVTRYVDGEGVESTLPLPPYQEGEPYFLGIFLVGAYQEILGDLHNLFGDTNAVNVELDSEGGYQLVAPERGDTIAELLNYVHFAPDELLQRYRQRINDASLSAQQREQYWATLEGSLRGYSYLAD